MNRERILELAEQNGLRARAGDPVLPVFKLGSPERSRALHDALVKFAEAVLAEAEKPQA